MSEVVNDIHSALNATRPARISTIRSVQDIKHALAHAQREGLAVIAAGGRHAKRGRVEVEAGIQWPEVVSFLRDTQDANDPARWTIIQKQSGADRFSLGGTVSANGHGRGLTLAPIVGDIEAITLVDPAGRVRHLSRQEDQELFALACGGYGLFGVVASVVLRLARFQLLERVVEIRTVDDLDAAFAQRVRDGFVFGDFQFSIDDRSEGFLREGVFSCYRPVDPATPVPAGQRILSRDDWGRLLHLAHTDRAAAYQQYTAHYAATSGQLYRSDALQMADYQDGYHRAIDAARGVRRPSSEVISELYVPRDRLADFLRDASGLLRDARVPVIYGTVRLIERDTETYLAWAREPWACIIFNVCTEHTPEGIHRSTAAFRGLIDLAVTRGGSYFLTYHRWATVEQLLAAHPRFPGFLAEKRRLDPAESFQSDWYRHYAKRLDER
jgi:FAD/FMN-containing dehydrogenase